MLEKNVGTGEGRVTIGTIVKLVEAEGGKIRTFTVVRPEDADPWEGRISEAAPIARAVLGHRVGDEIVAFTPDGERRYRSPTRVPLEMTLGRTTGAMLAVPARPRIGVRPKWEA